MIKFFRKIRQKLLAENKFSKYLVYAIGEIVLVVIGILIALQINNWNENKKLATRTQDYYIQLLDDLNSDILSVEYSIQEFKNHLKAYEDYTSSYDKEELSPFRVYEQLSKLSFISTPLTFNTNTIEALQNSGDIGLIPSDIRNELMDLRRLQNLTISRFDDTIDGQNDIIQKLSGLLGATTLPKRLEQQPKMKEFLKIDDNLRELILVYEGIHKWKFTAQQEAMGRLKEMRIKIDFIKKLIGSELEK